MQNHPLKVNLSDYAWETCTCGGYTFTPSIMIKKIPGLISPSGKEEFIPVEVMICNSCEKVPPFVAEKIPGLPEKLKSSMITIINIDKNAVKL